VNDIWIKIVGVLMVLGAGVTALWRSTKARKGGTAANFLYGIVMAAGIALILSDRIAEVSFMKIAQVKANVRQVKTDSEEVSKMKDAVKGYEQEAKRLAGEIDRLTKASEQQAGSIKIQAERFEGMSEFQKVATAAQANDREAFDQLGKWSTDENFPLREQSRNAWISVMDSHEGIVFEPSPIDVSWIKDADQLTLPELGLYYLEDDKPTRRTQLIVYVWKQKRFPIKERLKFLIDVLQREKRLDVLKIAANYVASVESVGTEGKVRYKRLYIDGHLKWWNENKIKDIDDPTP